MSSLLPCEWKRRFVRIIFSKSQEAAIDNAKARLYASSSHEVFDRLSDAAVQDAIQCQTSISAVAAPFEHGILRTNAHIPTPQDMQSPYQAAPSWPSGEVAVDNADEFLNLLYDRQYLNGSDMDLSQDWLGPLDAHGVP